MSAVELGRYCEELAAGYLQQIGYQLLEKNFRVRTGEIDLILSDCGSLVFAEVKHVGAVGIDSLEQLITPYKRGKIISTAGSYLFIHPECRNLRIRFDVLGIDADKDKVTHFKNAFGERALL